MRRLLGLLGAAMLAACGQEAGAPDLDVILADAPAATLAEYGLFEDAAAREPAAGVLSYDLATPLFSDHARKHRYVYIPDGQKAAYREDEVFDFPVGSVLVKTFAFAPDMRAPDQGERYRETRLLIRKADGWAAFPYVWNDAGTEARYAPAGDWQEVDFIDPAGAAQSIEYRVPNQNQCKTCHQLGDAIAPIGPKARNLNHDGPHGATQLSDWTTRGLLEGVPGEAPSVPDAFDVSAPLEARARAYLDVNCAHCHRPEGSASNSGLFLGYEVAEAVKLGVGKHPVAAGRGSGDAELVVVPGEPEQSIMTYRMASTEAGVAMPELGRALVDEAGVALVREWIAEMDAS